MPSKDDLRYFQSMPLSVKVRMTQQRIREWVREFGENGVYVSFSGGKDSTVLLHLVRELYPDVEAVFVDTGLEYPEIRCFVRTFDNVTVLFPKMRFDEVIRKYGYPIISKSVSECVGKGRITIERGDITSSYRLKRLRGEIVKDGKKSMFNCEKYEPLLYADFRISNKCCCIMKESPSKAFARKTGKKQITGQMAVESLLRTQVWLKNGCNGFSMKNPTSNPLSFWTEQDVLAYIKQNCIPIAPVYGDIVESDEDGIDYDQNLFGDCAGSLHTTGCNRTGCIFCCFGCHLDKSPSRFERLKKTHPKQYAYCLGGGAYDTDGLWKPTKEGLGMQHVFDELNKLYGDGFIKY